MRIGFTGTREGLTPGQQTSLIATLAELDAEWGHHGDCVGADADFHEACRHAGMKVKIHPPVKDDLRAFCEGDEQTSPKAYLTRNRDIVNETELLIVCPKEMSQQAKGGTWYTFGFAKAIAKKPFILIWPDGSVWDSELENFYGS